MGYWAADLVHACPQHGRDPRAAGRRAGAGAAAGSAVLQPVWHLEPQGHPVAVVAAAAGGPLPAIAAAARAALPEL